MDVDLAALLGMVVSWALIDSIDPCIFALFTSLLASSILTGTRRVTIIGCTFISCVYVGYMLFGLLLRVTVVRLPVEFLAALLLAYGLLVLLFTFREKEGREGFLCRENDVPCRVASALRLDRFAGSTVSTAILGLVASFTLLPCSAGLYVLYNFTTRYYGYALWIPLTALYTAIFVSPLVLILLAFTGLSRVSRIHERVLRHEWLAKIVGSALMVSVAVYMLVTS